MKSNISTNNKGLRPHKTYSPEEVLAAGGATAFGLKTGHNNQSIIEALNNLPPIEPFTEEEWNDVLTQLEKDK